MGRPAESNGELSALLVATVCVGLVLMLSLLVCYACVLRRLCCAADARAKRRDDSYPMGDVTLTSHPTESDRV